MMTTAAISHTPGPWEHSQNNGRNEIWAGDGSVFIAEPSVEDVNYQTATANARLIAAAPDLLEACEAALDDLKDSPYVVTAKLAAAIAKAKGFDGPTTR